MNNIFIGMLLVFLNFNLDIGASRIGLLPDFAGYIFMLRGLSELKDFGSRFSMAAPYVRGMAVYAGVRYAMDLLGMTAMLGTFASFALALLSAILSLFISYSIIMGIKEIETEKAQSLNSDRLYSTWKLLAVFTFLTFIAYAIPALALVCIIISVAIGIYYLYAFYKTKQMFYGQN